MYLSNRYRTLWVIFCYCYCFNLFLVTFVICVFWEFVHFDCLPSLFICPFIVINLFVIIPYFPFLYLYNLFLCLSFISGIDILCPSIFSVICLIRGLPVLLIFSMTWHLILFSVFCFIDFCHYLYCFPPLVCFRFICSSFSIFLEWKFIDVRPFLFLNIGTRP